MPTATTRPTARLTYWSGHGLAETVRLMLVVTAEPWEERVYASDAQNLSARADLEPAFADGVLAFDQVPLLEIDGLHLVQQLAIVRYLARKHGLYGANHREAAQIDILSEGVRDWATRMRDDSAAANSKFLPRLERALVSSTGELFVGASLSFIDVQWFRSACDALRLDPSCLDAHPAQQRHHERIAALADRRVSGLTPSISAPGPRRLLRPGPGHDPLDLRRRACARAGQPPVAIRRRARGLTVERR